MMTVAQLIEKLQGLDPNMKVMILGQDGEDVTYYKNVYISKPEVGYDSESQDRDTYFIEGEP